MTHNHDDYEERLKFGRQLMHARFAFSGELVVEPVDYDADSPFKYNNFVYLISLSTSITKTLEDVSQKPGCVAVPDGTTQLILRIANPRAEGMHPIGRTENEVAMLSLASAALSSIQPAIVPSVYGWGSIATGHPWGWILQEFKPGQNLSGLLEGLNAEQKRNILAQNARIVKCFHEFQLPKGIDGLGGVMFDGQGQIVSGVMPTVGKGPWSSSEAVFITRLQLALEKADANPHIKGWELNGVRERLNNFVKTGVSSQFEGLTTMDEKTITHADFQSPNILIDPVSLQITGLIDYDFSSIQHPTHEFLRSFSDIGEQFRGWHHDESGEDTLLRNAKLTGFPSQLPPTTKDGVDWISAKIWEEELERLGVKRPRTMPGIDGVANADRLLGNILPWRLHNEDFLRLNSPEAILRHRKTYEVELMALLAHLGY